MRACVLLPDARMTPPLSLSAAAERRTARERTVHPISPIAVTTVLTAAIAVAVVVAFQGEHASRVRVTEAEAVPDSEETDALRLYMTVINDGGADRVVAFRSPASPEIVVVGNETEAATDAAGPLALPADGAQVLDTDRYLLARAVDAENLTSSGFPLIIELERSDGIYVVVPLPDSEP